MASKEKHYGGKDSGTGSKGAHMGQGSLKVTSGAKPGNVSGVLVDKGAHLEATKSDPSKNKKLGHGGGSY
jgi:hypothetical protein